MFLSLATQPPHGGGRQTSSSHRPSLPFRLSARGVAAASGHEDQRIWGCHGTGAGRRRVRRVGWSRAARAKSAGVAVPRAAAAQPGPGGAQPWWAGGAPDGVRKLDFLKMFELLGCRCYLTDSITLKSILEVWVISFAWIFDQRHKWTGGGGTCTARCHQGHAEESAQIPRKGGWARSRKSCLTLSHIIIVFP